MAKKKKMITKLKYNYSAYGRGADIELEVDLTRFNKQYGDAQKSLDEMVMTSMLPYMPHRDGVFIDVTRAMSASLAGSGTVVAAAPPFGRFLYEGKVMVDEVTGSPWARKGAKKIVTDKNLDFDKSHNRNVTDHWFETAKKKHLDEWLKEVKETAGGG